MPHQPAAYFRRVLLVLLTALSVLAAPTCAAGDEPDLRGLFGAILNMAVDKIQLQQLWGSRPPAEYACLETHKTSAAILASHGIGPFDPRVQALFAQCNAENAAQPASVPMTVVAPAPAPSAAPSAASAPVFAVEGLPVGGYVIPGSAAYKSLKCRASEDYPGFQWCSRQDAQKGPAGAYDRYLTIFHSGSNQAALLMQDMVPAFFGPGEAEREIQRLSRSFGLSARVYNAPSRAELPHAIMAVWGDAVLTPLDKDTVEAMRRGDKTHAGLIADFLIDSRKSATLGLPIYHIGGGAGYVWTANWSDSGAGRLRIRAVNANLLPGGRTAAPDPPPAPTPIPKPTPPPTSTFTPGERVALVIGNSAYDKFGALPNPRNDAELMTETLQRRGFKLFTLLDGNRIETVRTLHAFAAAAETADWAVVFYAGHGIEIGGVNYILPTDVQLNADLDAQDEAFSLDRVLAAVKSARKLQMVILDACRDNPFAKAMHRSIQSRGFERGLAPPQGATAGIIVLYSAEAGQLASDGAGEHSPFTTALVARINEPGLDVNLLPHRVASDVFKATDGRQRPFQYGSNLNSDPLYFTPPAQNASASQ